MRKFLMSMMAVALCAGVAIASEQGAAGKTCPMGAKKGKGARCVCTGTVEAVNAGASALSVKVSGCGKDAKEEVKEFTIAPDTIIKVGKKTAALSEVEVGAEVKLVCKGDAVKRVTVKKGKKEPGKKASKKTDAEKGGEVK